MKEKIDSAKHTEQIKILFSRFSHELRNPLALLSSELQLLASSHTQLSNDEQWENILENLEYIHALLDDMSRYQNAGQLSLVLTDLSPCLNEISRSFRPVLKYLEIEFKTDIPDNLPKLSLDPLKIRQESTAQYVHISVQDNGCGMTPSQKSRIFEPFITYKSGGTGLGLSVARQIIEAHHGSIKVESAPGIGSTFHVYIPLDPEGCQNRTAFTSSSRSPSI